MRHQRNKHRLILGFGFMFLKPNLSDCCCFVHLDELICRRYPSSLGLSTQAQRTERFGHAQDFVGDILSLWHVYACSETVRRRSWCWRYLRTCPDITAVINNIVISHETKINTKIKSVCRYQICEAYTRTVNGSRPHKSSVLTYL